MAEHVGANCGLYPTFRDHGSRRGPFSFLDLTHLPSTVFSATRSIASVAISVCAGWGASVGREEASVTGLIFRSIGARAPVMAVVCLLVCAALGLGQGPAPDPRFPASPPTAPLPKQPQPP